MQSNTTAARLRKTRESATTALNPGSEEGKCQQYTKDKGEREGKEREQEEEGVIQSHQRPHSQDRETERESYEQLMK